MHLGSGLDTFLLKDSIKMSTTSQPYPIEPGTAKSRGLSEFAGVQSLYRDQIEDLKMQIDHLEEERETMRLEIEDYRSQSLVSSQVK